jgi:CheY-like chemotaxis protein
LVADVARDAGCQVVGEATDGVEAVVAAIKLEPDLVITDWRMPELDGVAATAAIRARRPDIEVIALARPTVTKSKSAPPPAQPPTSRSGSTAHSSRSSRRRVRAHG